MKTLVAIAALVAVGLWPSAVALADGTSVALRAANGYWSEGEPRPFVSAKIDLGIPYTKPGLSFGYGLPHWIWTGVDVNAISTLEFAQTYAGVRAASPILDLAFGARDTWSYGKTFVTMPPFTGDDLYSSQKPKARYWAWEAEAVASVPLPSSGLVADFIVVHTLDVPPGKFVYDESYRVIVKDPLFYVLRLAAVARLLREDALKIGVMAVHVFGTGRDQGVWQLGPAAALQLTDHLEIVTALAIEVSSPDSLGLSLGAYGIAGFRYRWASGEKSPALPWKGPLIL